MSPAKRKQYKDLEEQLLDLLKGTIGGMDSKISKESRRNNKQDERLDRLEDELFPQQPQNVKQLAAWYRDPAIIKLFTFIVAALVLLLIIVASLRGIKLPGLFG